MINKRERELWTFTFGSGQKYGGRCVKIYGTFAEARSKMIDRFGLEWAFQYSEKEWEHCIEQAEKLGYRIEKEMPL